MKENVDNVLEFAGGVVGKSENYSKYFHDNYENNGSPKTYKLEQMFQDPQTYINDIIALSKYYYYKNGLIMRVINIMRDFGTGVPEINYPTKHPKVRKIIEQFNKRIGLQQTLKDILFEKALTGNCAGYNRDGSRIDIFPISKIDIAPVIVNNKSVLIYKLDTDLMEMFTTYSKQIDDIMKEKLSKTYPKEIVDAIAKSLNQALLDVDNTFFTKTNVSRYEKYGIPFIITAFDELAHKTLLKEAESATATGIIEKILRVSVGDKDHPPKKGEVEFYDKLLSGQKGSIRVTVPYFVDMKWIEPDTAIFGVEKFEQVDKDLLSALGVSLTLIRGEGGGNYSDGVINIAGLIKTIENLREDIPQIVHEWYQQELERNGQDPEHAPTIKLPTIEIDAQARLEMVQFLFQNAGLPYEVLYKECGYDYMTVKLTREQENKDKVEDTFKLREQPFQGQNAGGAPTKNTTARKSDKSKTERNGTPKPST